MELYVACKLLDDVKITNTQRPNEADLKILKDNLDAHIIKEKARLDKQKTSSSLLLTQYQAALEVINLNLQLHAQEKDTPMHADIDKDGKISVSLFQTPKNDGSTRNLTPSLKKIFEVEKQGDALVIKITKDPTDRNAPSDEAIAKAMIGFAKANGAHTIIMVHPDKDSTLGPLSTKIKDLCQQNGISFLRQSKSEHSAMSQMTNEQRMKHIEKLAQRETSLDKAEVHPQPSYVTPRPSPFHERH